MFSIYDGRTKFYQWDLDRKIIVKDDSIAEVHFCNRTDSCSLVVETYKEGALTVADVPNVLLQTDWRINVYAYDSNYTKFSDCFEVVKRTKPADYIYTETELKNYKDLEDRVNQIEQNGVSDEKIAEAVNDYLEENEIEVDLSDYYTKSETDKAIEDAVGAINIGGVALDEIQISNTAPTDENIKVWINPDEADTEYALKSDIPDVSAFQTEEDVNALINTALGVIENGTY